MTEASIPFPKHIERGGWSADQMDDAVLYPAPVRLVYGVMAWMDFVEPGEDFPTEDPGRLARLNKSRTFKAVSVQETKPHRFKHRDGHWVTVEGSIGVWFEREDLIHAPLTRRKVLDFIKSCTRISGDRHHIYFEGLLRRDVLGGIPIYTVELGS